MVPTRRSVILGIAAFGSATLGMYAGPASANQFVSTELSYDSALLSQFNLINLGNYSSSSSQTIAGRALVGGNATIGVGSTLTVGCSSTGGTGTAPTSACNGNSTLSVGSSTSTVTMVPANTASSSSGTAYGYGALTVFGNVTNATGTAASTISAPNGGDIDIGGSVSISKTTATTAPGAINQTTTTYTGGINVAGAVASGTVTAAGYKEYRSTAAGNAGGTDTVAQVFAPFAASSPVSTNFKTPLQDLYAGLANLPGTPGTVALASTQTGFLKPTTAGYSANGDNYGVVTTTLLNFETAGTAGFTGVENGTTGGVADSATFVIITGDGAGTVLPTISTSDSKVIYDFVSASTLKTGSVFDGTILAPLATLTQGTGVINGSVVVASLIQDAALSNTNAFTGDLSGLTNLTYNARVPEPSSMAIVGSGLAGLAWFRRKRKPSASAE